MITKEEKTKLMELSQTIDKEILKTGFCQKEISMNEEHYNRLSLQVGDKFQTPKGLPLHIEEIQYNAEESKLFMILKYTYNPL